MKNKPEMSIAVNGYDVLGADPDLRHSGVMPEELEAIARVFNRAAQAIRNKEHGQVDFESNLANIGIDFGGDFSDKTGLPMLEKIKITKKSYPTIEVCAKCRGTGMVTFSHGYQNSELGEEPCPQCRP